MNLPAGFELEEQGTNLPPGFEMEPPPRLSPYERTLRGQQHLPEQIGEGALSVLSNMALAPVAGLRGIWEAAGNGPEGAGAKAVEDTMAMAYQPRTPVGQMTANAISAIPGAIADINDWAGRGITRNVMGITGNPTAAALAGTGANVGLNALEMLFGKAGGKMKPAPPRPVSAVSEALDAGLKLTPTQIGKGVPLRAIEGMAGSAKTEKLASIQNQPRLNEMIAEDFGIKGRKMTDADFPEIYKKAGQAYEDVKRSGIKLIKPDQQFRNDLQALRGDYTRAAAEYPGMMKNDDVELIISELNHPASPNAMVELTRKLRADAAMNIKAFDKPAQKELGYAQRNAATALEEQIDRALISVGKVGLVDRWRGGRRLYAKLKDAESAFNESTGDFSAPQLKRMYERGKPFDGNMEKVAKFAQAFEGSAREPWKMKDKAEFGALEYLAGAGALAGHTVGLGLSMPTGVGLVLARPTARHMLITKPFQTQKMRLSDVARVGDKASQGLMLTPAMGLRRPPEEE
jgi:hypothetical protein